MNGKLRRACALGVIGLLAGGVLGACGGNDEAVPKPKFSSSAASPSTTNSSPTAASSSAAPEESPEDFVRRWNAALTEMQNDGRSSDFRAISNGCDACATVADLVDRYYGAGGSVETAGWTFKSISCTSASQSQSECVAKGHNPVTTVQESASAEATTLAAGPISQYFRLGRKNGSWNMDFIAREAS